jgi:YD repeat-containing protein
MKNSIKYLIIFGMIGFLSSCGKGTESTPAKVCKLQSERYSPQGSSGDVTSYEYNAQKQLAKTVKTYGNTASETSTFTYDSNGFLTGINSEYVYNSGGTTYRTTITSRCEYRNNQLSLLSSQINPSTGTASNESYTLEYDSQQKLSKVVYSSSNATSSRQTYTFSNDKLIGYVSRTPSGVETQPYVIENGLIKRNNGTNSYSTYEYDTQGKRTRSDTWQSGRITYSYVVAYEDNGKNSEEANPIYQSKGWYDMKVWGFILEYRPGLRSKETYYLPNGSNLYKASESIYNNALNTKGFPTLINKTSTTFNTNGTVNNTSNNSTTYTYTDCE